MNESYTDKRIYQHSHQRGEGDEFAMLIGPPYTVAIYISLNNRG